LIIHRRLIVPLAVAIVATHAGLAFAEGAATSSFPVNGAAPITGSAFERGPIPSSQAGPSDDCNNGFMPLRAEAETRGKLIKAASDRHAPPDEACKLIGSFGQAEIKMIKYIESHAAKCGIPAQVGDQMKNGHKNTEAMLKKVCAVAQQVQHRGPSGPTGDFWTLPEKQL
jgi:hypothetical protein